MTQEARDETDLHVQSVIKATPDLDVAVQLDKDIQGIGAQW